VTCYCKLNKWDKMTTEITVIQEQLKTYLKQSAQGHSKTSSGDSRYRHTFDESKNINMITSAEYTLFPEEYCTRNSLQFTGKRRVTLGPSYAADFTLDFTDGSATASVKVGDKALMDGWLYKTSRQKGSKTRTHGQHRRFRLTTYSLEYSHMFQRVYYTYNYMYMHTHTCTHACTRAHTHMLQLQYN